VNRSVALAVFHPRLESPDEARRLTISLPSGHVWHTAQATRRGGVNTLSDRELASLAWIGLVAVSAVFWRPMRQLVTGVVGALLQPVFLVPFALLGLYTAAIVGLASLTPAWNTDLLNDTVLWFFTVGVVLMFRAVNAAKEEGWFLRQAIRTVRLTVFLEFYLNFHTLPFWGEFALQGWLLVLILADGAVQLDRIRSSKDLVAFGRVIHGLQAITGLALLAYVAIWVISNWATVDWGQSARELLLPVWLTVFTLPFLFAWAWYLGWDAARRQLAIVAPGDIGFRTRLAMLLGYGLRVRRPYVGNAWGRELVEAPTLRAKLRVAHEQRARVRRDQDEKRRKVDNLERYAGYSGTDAAGRRLDRREFAETIQALETLSSAHMGWYRNEPAGRYKAKLTEFMDVYARGGLPDEHGITMEVSADGQSWYAWRRTAAGWVFAVGAAAPPPDQRFYDGEYPPKGFPGPKGRWGLLPFERGPNWDTD
jgi:thiamine transporter ThiT